MHILAVGLNYKTAPVEIRERLSFSETEIVNAMKALQEKKSVLENIIISTCNRTEIYAVVDQVHTGRYYIKEFLSQWFELPMEDFSPFLFIHSGDRAVEHLYQVSCGLDSMILGETQILGQVRTSYLSAQNDGTIGTVFNYLFKQAITLAKRAHSETEINTNAVSVSYAAVELAKKIFGSLTDKNVLVIGAGKMGELAIQNLYSAGAKKVTVINRTHEKAIVLAEKFSGKAIELRELQCALLDADIVISSTGAKEYVVTKELMNDVNHLRKGRPIFMVDIAVPRDLDPALDQLESVFLYDIDDLEGIVEANIQERRIAAEAIYIMIEEELVEFNNWLSMLGVVPVISALRDKAMSIQAQTMESLERKLPQLSDRDRKIISKHTKSIINQMLKDPVLYAKELAGQKNREDALQNFVQTFNIAELVKEQKNKQQRVQTVKENEINVLTVEV
ncbi:MAG: glutamyl-tRNA reductase [Bacillus sp. (in: firmicutes)]